MSAFTTIISKINTFDEILKVRIECTANLHSQTVRFLTKKFFFKESILLGKHDVSINGFNLVLCDIEMNYCFDMLHLARKSNPRIVILTTVL